MRLITLDSPTNKLPLDSFHINISTTHSINTIFRQIKNRLMFVRATFQNVFAINIQNIIESFTREVGDLTNVCVPKAFRIDL